MEGSVLEFSLSIKRMMNEKGYRESQLVVIIAAITALLNSYGGDLNLKFEDDAVSEEKDVDGVLRMIEQRLVDTIGLCTFNSNVKMPQLQNSRVAQKLVLVVERVKSLCTVNYNLYLPTQKQVKLVLPSESSDDVKVILNREVHDCKKISSVELEDFVLNKLVPFTESNSIQFKLLKAEKSKCVSLADRMTNKSNKLNRYISGFANKDGGKIFYGITDDGIVKGEATNENHKEEIVRKVSKVIDQMIWDGGKLERGKHWDIQFVPVKDEEMKEIPSLFVIIVTVSPLPGGLFTGVPECYHVVHGRVERMSFTEWRCRLFPDEQPTKVMVPSIVHSRTKWSSVKTQRICHKILQQLLKYQNDGNFSAFENFAAVAEQNHKDDQVLQLFISGERTKCAHKRGQLKKANSLLTKLEEDLSSLKEPKDNADILMLRAIYAKAAIARAKENFQESYTITQAGLQLAERVPAGIITAWFYNHVAMVEKLLSLQTKDAERARLLVQSAQDHFIKALQHTQASSVEQEFSTTIADLQQRTHIYRATALLGNFASGPNFRKATPSDIKEAETDLSIYNLTLIQGHKETNYRKINYLMTLSDLRMCQWWQQRQLQTQEERSSQTETPDLLKDAFDYATQAKVLSMKYYFEQLTDYANNRLAVIIEVLIKLKVSSMCLPGNINDD